MASVTSGSSAGHPRGRAVLGSADVSRGMESKGTLMMNMDAPDIFTELASPTHTKRHMHAERHMHADAMGAKTRKESRKWIVSEAEEYLKEPEWKHADRVGDIASLSSFRSTASGSWMV